MSILAADKIEERLNEIFIDGTYDVSNIAEASYCLRLSDKYLYVNEKWYGDDEPVYGDITIKKGDIVCLSTIEEFTMPIDLVGHYDLKFKQAIRGLVLLNGGRVDPGYGEKVEGKPDKSGQKLFVFVMNMGPKDVDIRVIKDEILIVEFHEIKGIAKIKEIPRQDNHLYLGNFIKQQAKGSNFGFLPHYTKQVNKLRNLETKQNLLVIGIGALLIMTILGVVLSFSLTRDILSIPLRKQDVNSSQEIISSYSSKYYIKERISKNDSLYVLFYTAIEPRIGDYLQIIKEIRNETGSVSEVVGIAKVVGNIDGTAKAIILDKTEECEEGFFLVKK